MNYYVLHTLSKPSGWLQVLKTKLKIGEIQDIVIEVEKRYPNSTYNTDQFLEVVKEKDEDAYFLGALTVLIHLNCE